jgi:heat shock protein HslJ
MEEFDKAPATVSVNKKDSTATGNHFYRKEYRGFSFCTNCTLSHYSLTLFNNQHYQFQLYEIESKDKININGMYRMTMDSMTIKLNDNPWINTLKKEGKVWTIVEGKLNENLTTAIAYLDPSKSVFHTVFWESTFVGNEKVPSRITAFIKFDEDYTFIITGGCNMWNGYYFRDKEHLTFQEMRSTQIRCPDKENVDDKLLEVIQKCRKYKLEGKKLKLIGAEGKVIAEFTTPF